MTKQKKQAVFATAPRRLSPEEIMKVSGGEYEAPSIKSGSGQDNQVRQGF
jgi:hypothetical protein